MIALFPILLALSADPPRTVAGLPIDGLAPQALPASGCAAYLFTTGEPRVFAAMASAAGTLRLSIDGQVRDIVRAGQQGEAGYGFARTTEYRDAEVSATLDLSVAARADVSRGASVPEATLRIDRNGKDGVVLPMVGLIGCA